MFSMDPPVTTVILAVVEVDPRSFVAVHVYSPVRFELICSMCSVASPISLY